MEREKLKIIGAMLYACEGTKARIDRRYDRLIYSIELTNSDPKIIRAFSAFLQEIINADWNRVRGQLFYYPDLNEKELIEYWSKASSIPLSHFQKSILLKGKDRFKPNPYGTFKIRYSCKNDFLKMQKYIDEIFGEVA